MTLCIDNITCQYFGQKLISAAGEIPKMESGPMKYYHEHDFHSRGFIEDYFCKASVFYNEFLKYPMEKLHQVFNKDHIQGDLCIDISSGSYIHHLLSACDCFKEIIVMKVTDSCIFEINRWLHDRTGAFSWNHTSSYVAEKQGNSDLYEHKEMQLKNKITKVIRCNLEEENITEPVETPQGDCVISTALGQISKNQNDFVRNLRQILTCLKAGGTLILFVFSNATYYINNGEKFHLFKCDKEFICSALLGEKLIIDQCEVFPRCAKSDLYDFDGVIFICAHKEK
ncbi:nicotinamide N-methyltransferase-like [Gastrophryne carolinensis]